MILKTICFTKTGYELACRLQAGLQGYELEIFYKGSANVKADAQGGKENAEVSVTEISRQAFAEKTPLLFIGAIGIAVRHIAPFVKDKLSDPPVLVMDEKGLHVIPLLSGHVGGANALAYAIAEKTGADPVITTATDLQKAFSVDLFAKENGLQIINRDGIAKVSVKALEGKPVVLSVKDYPPEEPVDVIITNDPELFGAGKIALQPPAKEQPHAAAADGTLKEAETQTEHSSDARPYTLGIGCKKGKSADEIAALVEKALKEAGISLAEIYAIGSIDLKAEEPGLREFAASHNLPFITFDAALLAKAKGDFSHSGFVKDTTGVDNVCERAAVLAAGPGGKLIRNKTAENGVTVAVAERSRQEAR